MSVLREGRWYRMDRVRNDKYKGCHWEIQGGLVTDGLKMMFILGKSPTLVTKRSRLLYVGVTEKIETVLRQMMTPGMRYRMQKSVGWDWDWVAVSVGGDLKKRSVKWKARMERKPIVRFTQPTPAVRRELLEEAMEREDDFARQVKEYQEALARGEDPVPPAFPIERRGK